MPETPPTADLARYIRQVAYPRLGEAGQRRLMQSTALIAGCGALGSMLATMLVRAGVGRVRLVDDDVVETHNLQRQFLFTERHARDAVPKVVAAAEVLRQANSTVAIEPLVARIDGRNVIELCEGVDVIVDGLDNFPSRYVVNDAAVKRGLPWVTGGVVGAEGQTMTVLPGETACLRCLMPECPSPGSVPTCDDVGILGPAMATIAALEGIEAMKILAGHRDDTSRQLTVVELWDARIRQIDISQLRDQADCPCCKNGRFEFLRGESQDQ